MPATDNPEFWRFRAEEVRTIAEEMKHAKPKAIMARIADDYEGIANFFEEYRKQQYAVRSDQRPLKDDSANQR